MRQINITLSVYLFDGNIMKIYDEKISNIVLSPPFWKTWRLSNRYIYCFIAFTHIRIRLSSTTSLIIWAFGVWILVDIFGSLCYYRIYGIFYGVQLLKHRKNHDPVQKPIRNWKRTSLPRGPLQCARPHQEEAIENGQKHLKSLAENARALCVIISGRLCSNVVFIG